MMKVANSTPVAGTFLELGILPIQFEIDMRKLSFLWKILQKENVDPVKQIYKELKHNCLEKNWAHEVMGLRSRCGLLMCNEETECTCKMNGVKRLTISYLIFQCWT